MNHLNLLNSQQDPDGGYPPQTFDEGSSHGTRGSSGAHVARTSQNQHPDDSSGNIARQYLNFRSMDPTLWIVDTGATDHMVMPQCDLFNIKKLAKPIPIGFGEDQTTLVHTYGSFHLSENITIHQVLQVPTFNVNLLSVSQLTKDTGQKVIFDENSFCIQDRRGISIGTGRRVNGLYILCTRKALTTRTTPKIWHRCLGYPCSSRFSQFYSLLNDIPTNFDNFCDTCPLSKQKGPPFRKVILMPNTHLNSYI